MSSPRSDALVFFGATGALAYKKIFPALQSMVHRGRLDVCGDSPPGRLQLGALYGGGHCGQALAGAVDLSRTKYCGVSAMLKHTADITHEIIIES